MAYYFGDLSYSELPNVCVEALENGFDGRALRRLAGLVNSVARDMKAHEIDLAFCELGVNAPIPKDEARLFLAAEAARKAVVGESNVFDAATHIRIHICGWKNLPPELRQIVDLSEQSEHAPRLRWKPLEKQLHAAMVEFLRARE